MKKTFKIFKFIILCCPYYSIILNKTAFQLHLHVYAKAPSWAHPLPSQSYALPSLPNLTSSHPTPTYLFLPQTTTQQTNPPLPTVIPTHLTPPTPTPLYISSPLLTPSHPYPSPSSLHPHPTPALPYQIPCMVKSFWLFWEHVSQLVYPSDRQYLEHQITCTSTYITVARYVYLFKHNKYIQFSNTNHHLNTLIFPPPLFLLVPSY